MQGNNNRKMSRRVALKALGVVTVPAVSAVAKADEQEKYEKHKEQALHLLDKTRDSELFRQYLRNHGFVVDYTTVTEPITHSDDVSTQDRQGNITTTVTNYEAPCQNDFYTNFEWEYDTNGDLWINEADINTVSFDNDHFNIENHTASSYSSFLDDSGSGVAYKWEPEQAYNNNVYSGHINATLDPRGDYSKSKRIIMGNVHHFHMDWDGGYYVTWYGDGSVEVTARTSGGVRKDPEWVSHAEKPQSDAHSPC